VWYNLLLLEKKRMNISLGALIKHYRMQKRLSQLDIASAIGWKDTSRLSKIEQGRVRRPTKKLLEKILDALNLSVEERGEFLLTGGYLPNNEDIRKVIKSLHSKINNWPYPAYLIDFSWRLIVWNDATAKIFHIRPQTQKKLLKVKLNLLELPFLSKEVLSIKVAKGGDEEHLKLLAEAQVARFKVEQAVWTSESWYKDLIRKMMKNTQFARLWREVEPRDYQKEFLDYEYEVIEGQWDGQSEVLRFYILTSKLIMDPRFQLVTYLPVDEATSDFFLIGRKSSLGKVRRIRDIKSIIDFAKELGKLKTTKRAGWVKHGIKNPESVADHDYRLSALAMVFAKDFNLDIEKVMKMAILDDMAEGRVGDLIVEVGSLEKGNKDLQYSLEKAALNKLFSFINGGKEYVRLWEEFQQGQTKEARLVKQLDKLEMAIQALEYETDGYSAELFNEFWENVDKYLSGAELEEFFVELKKARTKLARIKKNRKN